MPWTKPHTITNILINITEQVRNTVHLGSNAKVCSLPTMGVVTAELGVRKGVPVPVPISILIHLPASWSGHTFSEFKPSQPAQERFMDLGFL